MNSKVSKDRESKSCQSSKSHYSINISVRVTTNYNTAFRYYDWQLLWTIQSLGSAAYVFAQLSSLTFPVNQHCYPDAKMTFWNFQGFQGCRYFQLYQPWLSQHWVAKLAPSMPAWPFKLMRCCCHSKMDFSLSTWFDGAVPLNCEVAILSIRTQFPFHEKKNVSFMHTY